MPSVATLRCLRVYLLCPDAWRLERVPRSGSSHTNAQQAAGTAHLQDQVLLSQGGIPWQRRSSIGATSCAMRR